MESGLHRRTLVHEWLERESTLVVYQDDNAPSPEEWSGYLAQLRRIAQIEHRVLLYTEIHLSRPQQAEIADATRSHIAPRVAVLSPSTAVRFVASIFTLLNRNIRFFSPAEYAAAITHLELKPQEIESVTQCYGRLMECVRSGNRNLAGRMGDR